jgi:hypothetical protein
MLVYHRPPSPDPIPTPCLVPVDAHGIGSGFWFHLYPAVTIGFAVTILEAVFCWFAVFAYSPVVTVVANEVRVRFLVALDFAPTYRTGQSEITEYQPLDSVPAYRHGSPPSELRR